MQLSKRFVAEVFGIRDLKGLIAQQHEHDTRTLGRPLFHWTPVRAIASLLGALLFAWGFLHLILVLVFPRAPTLH